MRLTQQKQQTKSIIKTPETEMRPSLDEFTIEFYLNFKEPRPILPKLVHKIEEEGVLPSYQCQSQTKRQQRTPQSNLLDEHKHKSSQ